MGLTMRNIREQEIEELIRVNNYRLLGQIYVSDESYAGLLTTSEWNINHLYMQTIPKPDLILSLILVQVASRHYQEGKFWKVFNEQIDLDISAAKQNYIGQIFIQTIRAYNLLELRREEDNTQMYVENIKAHAFVTNYYMNGFYDFSYAYYENNLFRQIPDDIGEDLEDLAAFMQSTLSLNKDAITAGNDSKRAAKSYRLLKSTRSVFAQCEARTIQKVFNPVLALLDRYFYDGDIPIIAKDRFEQGFIDWCKENEKSKESEKRTRTMERRLTSHKPYLQVDIQNETACLVIPAQKFRMEDCDGNASVNVTINGHTVTKTLELYRSFGIYISEPINIPLTNIFDGMDIEVISLTTKNYRLNEKLYRIFNDRWENTTKFSDGHNYLLTKKGAVVTWKEPEDIIESYEDYRLWNYCSANIGENSICYVEKHPLSIIGEFSIEPVFDHLIERFKVYKSNREIIATKRHPAVSFVVDNSKLGGTVLVVNDRKYILSVIKEKACYTWPENKNKTAVTISLDEMLCHTEGYFKISLNIPAESNQILCDYIVLQRFDCRFNKRRFMYDSTAELNIIHNDYILNNIAEDWCVIDETKISTTYSIPITNSLSEVQFDLCLDGLDDKFTLSMPIHIFMYGFSKSEMHFKKDDYIWYADVKETLYIKLIGAIWVGVYWGRESKNISLGEEISPGLFRVDISELARRIQQEYKIRWQYINISYIDNLKRIVPLPAILRNVIIDPFFKLEYSEGKAYIDVEIKGDATPYLTIKNSNTEDIVISHRKVEGGINELPEISIEGFYDLYPMMEEADEFGLDVTETALKIIRGVGCIDINNLVNCRLIISTLIFEEEKLGLNYEYLIYLTEKESDNVYIGFMNCMRWENGRYNKDTLKKFGRIKLSIYQTDEEIRATMQMFSYQEECWMDPYYDTDQNTLISCDNKLLDKVQDPNRFILLDEKYTEYVFDRNKLRRTR